MRVGVQASYGREGKRAGKFVNFSFLIPARTTTRPVEDIGFDAQIIQAIGDSSVTKIRSAWSMAYLHVISLVHARVWFWYTIYEGLLQL